MADFQQSLFSKRKVSNGNAYDDVFGGPPKYSVPSVPSRVDDYSEIFGNFFAPRTSSIPVLDFPLLDDDRVCLDVPNSKFDYTEVFGGFDAADFAVPYEELFLERQAPQNPSRSSWSHDKGAAEQVPDVVSTAPLEQDGRDFLTGLDMNQSFSNGTSEHIYNGTEQFSVSYNKSNQGSKREPLSGTTHIAHFHDVPGYTVVVDSCPLLNKNKNDSCVVSKPGLSPKGDSIGEAMEEIHSKEISSPILGSDEVAMTSEIIPDEKHLCSKQIDQKDVLDSGNSDTHCLSNQMPSVQKASLKQIHLQATASDGTSAGDQHKSCNPVADLPSVADNPFEKVVFLTITDINLRTQPSQLPPPSRPPPKLGNSKKLNTSLSELYSRRPMKTTETYHFGSSFDTYALQDNDVTPPFFDVEVDASSAAAAAMRVAMEKAQAKLKSAKESMERKKDGNQGRMKLNLNEDKNIKEQRMSRTTRENNMLKDEESLESSATWKPDIKDFVRADRWKMMNTTEIASDYERKMDRTELTTASKDKWHGKNFTSHDALQQEKKASDWKVEKQYYELINNEKAFRLAAENNEMNLKTVGRNPMFVAKAVNEEGILENNDTFKALKEPYLQKDRNQTSKVGKTACKLEEESKAARPYAQDREFETNEKVLQTSKESLKQEDLRWKVDKMVIGHNEYVYGLNVACENERGERGQKLDFEREKEEKRWDMAYECVGDEHVSIVGELAHMHKWEEHCEHDEEQKRQKAAHELEEEEKRLKVVHEREKEDRSVKAARKLEEEEKRLKAACEREEEEKRHKAAHDHEEEEKRLKVAIEHEEVEKRLSAAYEHKKEERRLKAAHKCEEEEKRLKAASELEAEEKKVNAAHECREDEMGLKAAREHDEEVMRLKAAYEVEEEKKVEVARKLEDEKNRLQTAFPCEEVKTFNAVWVNVQEEKRPKETRESQEDRLKYACETEEENKRTSIVHAEEEKRLEANCMKGLERDTVKASQGCEVKEKIKKENQNEKERPKYEPEEEINSKIAYDACDTERYGKNSEASKDTYKLGIDSKLVETVEWEVIGAELKTLHTGRENEEAEKKKPSVRQQEESEMLPNSKTSYGCDANEKQRRGNKKHKKVQDTDLIENRKKVAVDTVLPEEKINGQGLEEARMGGGRDGNAKAAYEDLEGEETNKKQTMTCEDVENMKEGDSLPLWPGEGKNIKGIHDVHRQAYNETEHKTDQATMKQEKKGVNEANGLMKNKNSVYECLISLDKDKGSNSLTASRKIIKEAEDRRKETVQLNGGKIDKTSLVAQERGREEKKLDKTYDRGGREREERLSREREMEKERLRKLEEEREREREREKDRIAVERATRESRERAATEARERTERAAVERALAEARQRAPADARERAEKASLAEKASNEAVRLKAERAAVERATAEARERAAEKAAERAAARDKPDSPLRQNTASDIQDFRGTQDESALRCKARLERHQRTVERAAKALAEKNLRDVLAQREQAERNRFAETLDADIRRWANGKEGNLRALLSTLQYILGPESGWQPVPLTDVITAVAVKRAYRKATLCVHPDKVQQRCATIQQKYICEKVFDLLKEAWNRFNSEER